jgi:hypothetical protein
MTCLTDDIDALSMAIHTIPALIIDRRHAGRMRHLSGLDLPTAALAVVLLVVIVTIPYRFMVAEGTCRRSAACAMAATLCSSISGLWWKASRKSSFHDDRKGVSSRKTSKARQNTSARKILRR